MLRPSLIEIALDIGPAEKVKNWFCPAKLWICRTFCPAEDFYCHTKSPAITFICPAVIPMKTTFVGLTDYKAKCRAKSRLFNFLNKSHQS